MEKIYPGWQLQGEVEQASGLTEVESASYNKGRMDALVWAAGCSHNGS